jgi:DNA-binding CsgD family transcriptional regulator
MLTHSATWRWDEVRLGPQSWRDPRSGWELDHVLEVLATVSSSSADHPDKADLVERILPNWALLEMDELELDLNGALRPRATTRVEGDLLAWIVGSLWGRPDTVDHLLGGWTLARIREDGAIGQLCVPLVPSAPAINLIACSVAGEDREMVLSLAARLTWLTTLASHDRGGMDTRRPQAPLTERQRAILHAMAIGLTNRQIASRINFSESTVRMESMAIYRTYGVHSRAAAVAAARTAGHLRDAGSAIRA